MVTTYLPNNIAYKIYNTLYYRYKYYNRKRITRVKNGTPCNFNWDIVNQLSNRVFNSNIVSIKYQKLSTWKRVGTYRLFLRLQNGSETSLIYKYCNYNYEDYPALDGFPVQLGRSEYVFSKLENENINKFLPKTFWSHRDKNDVYHYLVEDLTLKGYQSYLEPDDIIVKNLVSINKSLNSSSIDKRDLPFYDKNYSLKLIEYIRRLWESSWEDKYSLSFSKLDKISKIYLDLAFQDKKYGIIHGDFNDNNFQLKQSHNIYRFKVVDWEWAGIGIIHTDLASYFGDPDYPNLESYVKEFAALESWETYDYHTKWLNWAFMSRALFDMSYMIAQKSAVNKYSIMNIDHFILETIDNLMKAYTKVQNYI